MTSTVRSLLLSLALLGTLATTPTALAGETHPVAGHGSATSAWIEAVPALGGSSLAAYLARHEGRRLHPSGV